MAFKEYKGLDLVAAGNEILDRWKKNRAFEKSLELREGAPEFIFFEGPPSANGMPGIHHVMARSIKDAICRYKTQSGYKVLRIYSRSSALKWVNLVAHLLSRWRVRLVYLRT